MYKDTPEFRLFVYRQNSFQYGILADGGVYQINEQVKFDDGRAQGTIAWKYQDQERGLIYVIEDYSGYPFEVCESEIVSEV